MLACRVSRRARVATLRRVGPRVCFSSGTGDLSTPSHPSGLNFWGDGKGLGLSLPPNRPPLYQAPPLNEFVKRYYWLLKPMGIFSQKARTGVNSEAIFRSLEEQATQNVWFESLGLPRSWITEHSLLALHVWLFHNRFKVDYNVPGDFNGRRMQEQLFERFWEDTSYRIRNAGIAESACGAPGADTAPVVDPTSPPSTPQSASTSSSRTSRR